MVEVIAELILNILTFDLQLFRSVHFETILESHPGHTLIAISVFCF